MFLGTRDGVRGGCGIFADVRGGGEISSCRKCDHASHCAVGDTVEVEDGAVTGVEFPCDSAQGVLSVRGHGAYVGDCNDIGGVLCDA